MAVASTVFVKKIHLYASQFATLFRVNTATGWVSSQKAIRVSKPTGVVLCPGDVLLRGARPLQAGLHKGGGDLFGWKSELVTPEWCEKMMGKKIARVVNLECKYGTGRLSPEQSNFINQVNDAGGVAGEIKDERDVLKLLTATS